MDYNRGDIELRPQQIVRRSCETCPHEVVVLSGTTILDTVLWSILSDAGLIITRNGFYAKLSVHDNCTDGSRSVNSIGGEPRTRDPESRDLARTLVKLLYFPTYLGTLIYGLPGVT